MEILTNKQFNEQMRERSMKMAVAIHHLLSTKKVRSTSTSLINQLIRSSSSVAANYRSAGRGRSDAEFYSKICIVVEECDETVLWLDLIISAKLITTREIEDLNKEALELLYILASVRKKLKHRINNNLK